MQKKSSAVQVVPLIKAAIMAIIGNPVILYPLCLGVFLQLLILEILYFAPRFPLSMFFGPIIKRLWGEIYMHYPANFILLPKLFYYAQVGLYLLIGCFLNALAISIIAAVNFEKRINLKSALKECLPQYVYVVLASLLSFGFFSLLSLSYNKLIMSIIRLDVAGKKWLFVKKLLVMSEPYMNVLLGVIATVLFVFVIPVLVIEKKKLWFALKANFKLLLKSFWCIFAVVFLVTLVYVPVLLLRSNVSVISENAIPITQLMLIMISVLVTLAIDATVFTATTTYYLLKKENS